MPQSFQIYIFPPKYSLFWNKIKNIKQHNIYGQRLFWWCEGDSLEGPTIFLKKKLNSSTVFLNERFAHYSF